MRLLLIADMAQTGFGRVGRELGRGLMDRGWDVRVIGVNWRGIGGEIAAAERHGIERAREVFADRAYDDRGMLVSRKLPGAVIHDAALAAANVLRMVQEGAVISVTGKRVPVRVDTICVHGDNPAAVAMAGEVRTTLERAGVEVASLTKP